MASDTAWLDYLAAWWTDCAMPSRSRFARMLSVFILLTLSLLLPLRLHSAEASVSPASIPGLICFWDFQGTGDTRFTSKGAHAYKLSQMNGEVGQTADGIFGPASLEIKSGQWLRIKREDCPALNLRGKQEVTVIAWIKRAGDQHWQYIAGMWDERNAKRQYALFTSGHKQSDSRTMERTDANHQAHGYVSDVGGATPGKPFCFSYATGRQTLEIGQWYMVAFTYDHKSLRVYVNGELDQNGDCNPFAWDKPILDPGVNGADFTVAQRDVRTWASYPQGRPGNPVGFSGTLGGLAVYGRALDARELRELHAATLKDSQAAPRD